MTSAVSPSYECGKVWTISTTAGYTASGYLPAWADEDPSRPDVAPDRLHAELADMTHRTAFGGQFMRICPGAVDPGEDSVVFAAEMQCRPYTGGDSESRVPVLNMQVFDDIWITDLDPAGIAEVAAQFRCFADLLENRAVPELTAARADWERHHRLRHGSGRAALHGQITQPCPAAPDAHSL